jgi:hypothetical protein
MDRATRAIRCPYSIVFFLCTSALWLVLRAQAWFSVPTGAMREIEFNGAGADGRGGSSCGDEDGVGSGGQAEPTIGVDMDSLDRDAAVGMLPPSPRHNPPAYTDDLEMVASMWGASMLAGMTLLSLWN